MIKGFAKREKENRKLTGKAMAPNSPLVVKMPNFSDGKLFLEKCKQLTLAEVGPDEFFDQHDVVFHFGLVSKMKMRLGFDAANEVKNG